MKILIMGLPGSGKTTLAISLAELLKMKHINADEIRTRYNDWDFSKKGRKRQARRLGNLAEVEKNVIVDFVCPLPETRKEFNADIVIWMDTIKEGRYIDTNQMFVPPKNIDFHIITWKYSMDVIVSEITKINILLNKHKHKLNKNTQKEISEFLYIEKEKYIQSHKVDVNENNKIFNKGYLLGINHAIMIIDNWNKKDHGKVKAFPQ